MKKVFKQIRFGAVQLLKGGLPLGNSAVNIIENISGRDLATGEVKQSDWAKVALKGLGALIILYCVVKGYLPVEELVKILKSFI